MSGPESENTATPEGRAPGPSVSLIIPTYREAANIPVLVGRIKAVARAEQLDIELLVVDDRSDDGTAEAVTALGEGDWVKVVVRDGKRSLSWAVIEGLRRATHEIVLVMDADLSHPPEAIPRLLEALREPGVDFVLGSRYAPGGTTDARWPVVRRLNSLVARLLARPLMSVRDPTSGFFALRRDRFLSADKLNPTGYKIGLEIFVKCDCRNVREVPIHFSERLNGTTKLGLRQRLEYVEHLRRLWFYRCRARTAAARLALGTYRARVAACGLLVLAIWEIAVLVVAGESAPKPEDWKAAAAAVRASSSGDALTVFAPRWIDPVGRFWLGDRISLDQAARMDTARYRQVWELSIRGARAPELAGETPVSDQTFGRVRVRQFIRPAPTVTWDLGDRARIYEVDFEPRKGVLLELRYARDRRRLLFSGVNLGTELHVYAGLADYRARSENRATGLLQVLIDGREVTRGYVDNDSGWRALPVAPTQPGPHEVEFLVRVHDARGPVRLAVCVAAESRSPR